MALSSGIVSSPLFDILGLRLADKPQHRGIAGVKVWLVFVAMAAGTLKFVDVALVSWADPSSKLR